MELNIVLLKPYFSCQCWSLSRTSLSKSFVVLRKYPQESQNSLLSDPLDAGYVHGTEAVLGGWVHWRHLDVNSGVSLKQLVIPIHSHPFSSILIHSQPFPSVLHAPAWLWSITPSRFQFTASRAYNHIGLLLPGLPWSLYFYQINQLQCGTLIKKTKKHVTINFHERIFKMYFCFYLQLFIIVWQCFCK